MMTTKKNHIFIWNGLEVAWKEEGNYLKLDEKIRLLRNHCMVDRDTIGILGCNSRLDTIQAVVAKHLLERKFDMITQARINNALYLDE